MSVIFFQRLGGWSYRRLMYEKVDLLNIWIVLCFPLPLHGRATNESIVECNNRRAYPLYFQTQNAVG